MKKLLKSILALGILFTSTAYSNAFDPASVQCAMDKKDIGKCI